MSKRLGNIFQKVIDIDNIKEAHDNAKKDRGLFRAVQITSRFLEERARKISNMLKNHTYKVSKYRVSAVVDKGKKRILYKLPYYPDRIIQWAIMLQLEKLFTNNFLFFSCASIKKRGGRYASELLDKYLNCYPEKTTYCLKLDIKKFYPSIDREKLKSLLRRKIKDKDLLIELDKIIDSVENADLSHLELTEEERQIYTRPGKGIPIGSYLSQYLGNYYLSYFDKWLYNDLKCKYVVRYADDIVILGSSKQELWNKFYLIRDYLKYELGLEIKDNYQVFPVDKRGIDFVGYRHFRGYKLLRDTSLKTCKCLAKKIYTYYIPGPKLVRDLPSEEEWHQWNSTIGMLKWCDSKKFFSKYYEPILPIINAYYVYYINSSYRKRRPSHRKYLAWKPTKKYYSNSYHHHIHKALHKESVKLNDTINKYKRHTSFSARDRNQYRYCIS